MSDHTRLPIRCADGFTVSVQASCHHYCSPREDNLGFYTSYELGYPSESDPLILPYAEDADNPTRTVYGWVPSYIVVALLTLHGGIVGEGEVTVDNSRWDPGYEKDEDEANS